MTSTIAVAHRGRNERRDTCVRAVSRERSVNHDCNDAELLAAALSGDAAAWELMVARHTPPAQPRRGLPDRRRGQRRGPDHVPAAVRAGRQHS